MYTDSAYLHNSLVDFMDKTKPLVVGSCGTYHLSTRPKLPTHRPRGRLDFQILYIASGKAHFFFNGVETIVSAGHMVIYRPKEEQKYYYYGVDQTEVYWVHFTGRDVKKLLHRYGIEDHVHVIHTGTALEYKYLFLQMIQELKLCKADYEDLLVNHLHHLLIRIHRTLLTEPYSKSRTHAKDFDEAVQYFHKNYHTEININEYAAAHHMSVSWFIRGFKEYTDSTPTQYILSLRISNAQILLETTDYNITEIAEIVGYENPLYFSRLFKKQVGVSPSDFRKQLRDRSEKTQ